MVTATSVTGGRPPTVPSSRGARLLRERVLLIYRGGRCEAEWTADAGREHGRQRWPANRIAGPGGHAQGQERCARWLHTGAAFLPWVRANLVREHRATASAVACHDRPAFA